MRSGAEVVSRHLAQVVHADPSAVYEFASDVDHLPLWASGLAASPVTRVDDHLVVDSPMGAVVVRFAPRNAYGVLDHDVTLPTGATTHNAMRVLPHPDGAEVLFTLRQIDLTDEEFDRDASAIAADLLRLKDLLEA